MRRQMMSAVSVALLVCGVIVAYHLVTVESPSELSPPAVMDDPAAMDRGLTDAEVRYGLPPDPGGDVAARRARIGAALLAERVTERLAFYRKLQALQGFERAYLADHAELLDGLVIKESERAPDVDFSYGLDAWLLQWCEGTTVLRCRIAPRQTFTGVGTIPVLYDYGLEADARRWDGARWVQLPGGAVTAPDRIIGPADIVIHVPAGTELVFVSYSTR
jgi:hypothetical protein